MKTTRRTLTSRIVALFLCAVLVAGITPLNSYFSLAEDTGKYGTVTSYTGGDIVGSGTSEVVITADEMNLQWSAADQSIGRNNDGWWAGIKVTAPEGMTAEELENSQYQRKTYLDTEWTGNKSFWGLKDGDYYIQMWVWLSPELLNEATDNLKSQWKFDWDNDTVFEQMITLDIVPGDGIILTKDGVQVYPTLGTVTTYTGGSVSGSGTGEVTVTADEMNLQWSAADKSIGRDKDGWWAGIKVTAPKGMTETELENSVYRRKTYSEEEWTGNKSFWKLKDGNYYIQMWICLTPAVLNEATDELVSEYQFDWNNDGTYEQSIKFVIVPGEGIVLNKVEQSTIAFTDLADTLTYTTEPIPVAITGGNGDGQLKYEIEETEDVADVDEAGNLTLKRAGNFTIKVTKLGNDTYLDGATISKQIKVEKADQSELTFDPNAKYEITYNDNNNEYTNLATGGESSRDVVYSIISGSEYAEMPDEKTGTLKINAAGEITVKAVRPADEKYNATEKTYTLKVNKAEQKIAFEKGTNVELKYGAQLTYANVAKAVGLCGEKEITYEISGENALGVTVDATGLVTFANEKVGSVVIKASKAEDACYKACEATYVLSVEYAEAPINAISIEGTEGTNGWYTSEVTIVPATGYTISESNDLTGNTWATSLSCSEDGIYNKTVYLRDAEGAITVPIAITDLKIDKMAPTDLKVSYDKSTVQKLLESITFGIYTAPVTVTIEAKDAMSGISSFTYYYGENEEGTVEGSNMTSSKFTIKEEFRDTVSFVAKDAAGNSSEGKDLDTDGGQNGIVIDTTAPEVEVNYTYASAYQTTDDEGVIQTHGDVTINFAIAETNFDLSDTPQITVNGELVSDLEWKLDEASGKWKAAHTLKGNGEYKVEATFTDIAGNVMEKYSQSIQIANVAPVIAVSEIEQDYYNAQKSVEIKITEYDFDVDKLVSTITVTEPLAGVDAAAVKAELEAYLSDDKNWSHVGDVHTIVVAFAEDAAYKMQLACADKFDMAATPYESDVFVIDNKSPIISVAYSTDEAKNEKYYSTPRKATITIDEHNFDPKDVVALVTATRAVNAAAIDDYATYLTQESSWTSEGDIHTAIIEFKEDAEYVWSLSYTDLSERTAEKYVSETFVIDNVDPIIAVSYANKDVKNEKYYDAARNATVTITEHNFNIEDVIVNVTATNALDDAAVVNYENYIKNADNWTSEGDVHSIELPFAADAEYQWTLSYDDMADRIADTYASEEFVIDNLNPVIDVTYTNNDVEHSKYYDAARNATVTITEHNFNIDDVVLNVTTTDVLDGAIVADYETYVKDVAHWTSEGDVHTIELPFESDARYQWTLSYDDMADRAGVTYSSEEYVIDNVDPIVDVSYDNDDVKNELYYSAPRTATVTIKEHNLDIADVTIDVKAENVLDGVTLLDYNTYIKDESKWTKEGDVYTIKLPFAADAEYQWTLSCEDLAGRVSNVYSSEKFVIDNQEPVIVVSYDNEKVANEKYYDAPRNATVSITEHNFNIDDVVIHVQTENVLEGVTVTDYEAYIKDETKWTSVGDTYMIVLPFAVDAQYQWSMSYDDMADVEAEKYVSEVFVIDNKNPEIKVVYDNNDVRNDKYYNAQRTATVTITEHNFNIEDVAIDVKAENVLAGVTVVDYKAYIKDATKWTTSGDMHTIELPFAADAQYQWKLSYDDLADRQATSYESEVFVIDNVDPQIEVTYDNNTFVNEKYYDAPRTATVRITEHNFDAQKLVITVGLKDAENNDIASDSTEELVDYQALLTNPANWAVDAANTDVHVIKLPFAVDANYTVSIDYPDLAKREGTPWTDEFVVDEANPSVPEITYSTSIVDKILDKISFGFYNAPVKVTITSVDEIAGMDYFEWSYQKQDGTSENVQAKIDTEQIDYTEGKINASVEFELSEKEAKQLRGNITAKAVDKAGRSSDRTDEKVIVIEQVAPQIDVAYTSEDDAVITYVNDKNQTVDSYEAATCALYSENVTATITVTEENFFEGQTLTKEDQTTEVVHEIGILLKKTDSKGKVQYIEYLPEGAVSKYPEATELIPLKWNTTAENPDIHTFAIVYDADADYELVVDYPEDYSLNDASRYASKVITVDKSATIVDVEYEEAIRYLNGRNAANGLADADHVYYGDKTEVVVTVTEANFFEGKKRAKEDGTEEVIHNMGILVKKTDSKGKVTFEEYVPTGATQMYANLQAVKKEFAWNTTAENPDVYEMTIVYDAEADYQLIIDYPEDIVKNETMLTSLAANSHVDNAEEVYASKIITVDKTGPVVSLTYKSEKEATHQVYYDAAVTAVVTITEANFFAGYKAAGNGVGILLKKTYDDGSVEYVEYVPAGEEQKYAEIGAAKVEFAWSTTPGNPDIYEMQIVYDADADYELYIDYSEDIVGNKSEILKSSAIHFVQNEDAISGYKTKMVTVDTVDPTVSVVYDNTTVIETIDGREYLNAQQSATIYITEHNFRASDVDVLVKAVDAIGKDVKVEDYKTQLQNATWEMNGNVHSTKIVFSKDANYTFDIEYVDLAGNVLAQDYVPDLFTVDTTRPESLDISYSASVFDTKIDSSRYDYYSGQMTVTISAEDKTSGVYSFLYSYIKDITASEINAELLNEAIENADITYDGYKATATFTIPKKALNAKNQFNGTVEFTAYDISGNSSDKNGKRYIVVDNIDPKVKVSLNDPVNKSPNNNQYYYDGDIEGTIVIKEANFFKNDVDVIVSRDGRRYTMKVKWDDESTDVHTGTFKLSEEGDYEITFRYADRSTNEMKEYVSQVLTIDKTEPAITVSNVKANSANKDETYGFAITVNDANVDTSEFKPQLTAIIRKEDGTYTRKTISLGEMKTVKKRETYAYIIENLEKDGIYTLVCSAQDMAGNAYSNVLLDNGKEYDAVQLSINREGSTFLVDESVSNLVNQYYVYEVNEDIVVTEINTDPINNYRVMVNGKVLDESEYTTSLTQKTDEWTKRTYTIPKELFAEEGEYNVIIESRDKTKTTAYSDVKDLKIAFVVDRTAPILTISGLENGGRYQTDKQIVTVIPTDDGGKLYGMKVIGLDADGNPLDGKDGILYELSGEEFLNALETNDGKITFEIPRTYRSNIRIICDDYVTKDGGKAQPYDVTFENVTVDASGWVMFYADKTAFYGAIAGLVVLLGLIIFLILRKKSKEEKEA